MYIFLYKFSYYCYESFACDYTVFVPFIQIVVVITLFPSIFHSKPHSNLFYWSHWNLLFKFLFCTYFYINLLIFTLILYDRNHAGLRISLKSRPIYLRLWYLWKVNYNLQNVAVSSSMSSDLHVCGGGFSGEIWLINSFHFRSRFLEIM